MERARHLIQDCTDRNEFDQLGRRLDEAELMDPDAFELETWPHTMHFLSHLVACDLPNARFMFKRIPEGIASQDVDLQRAHNILQNLWNTDYPGVWKGIHSAWPPQYAVILEHLSHATRRNIFTILREAYQRIEVEKLSTYLGCSGEEAVLFCRSACGAHQVDGYIMMPSTAEEERLSETDIQKLQSILVQLGQ